MSLNDLPADVLSTIVDLAFSEDCTYFETTRRKTAWTERQLGYVLLSKTLAPLVKKALQRKIVIHVDNKLEGSLNGARATPLDRIQRWLLAQDRWRQVNELRVSKRMHDDKAPDDHAFPLNFERLVPLINTVRLIKTLVLSRVLVSKFSGDVVVHPLLKLDILELDDCRIRCWTDLASTMKRAVNLSLSQCHINSDLSCLDLGDVKHLTLASLATIEQQQQNRLSANHKIENIRNWLHSCSYARSLRLGSSESASLPSSLTMIWVTTMHVELPLSLCPTAMTQHLPGALRICKRLENFTLTDDPTASVDSLHSYILLKPNEAVERILAALPDSVHTIHFQTPRWEVLDAFVAVLAQLFCENRSSALQGVKTLVMDTWAWVAIMQDERLKSAWDLVRQRRPSLICIEAKP